MRCRHRVTPQAFDKLFFGAITSALLGIVGVLAVGTAMRFYFVSWLGERVTADLRNAVYSRVLRQSPVFFETTQTGEVLHTPDVDERLRGQDRESVERASGRARRSRETELGGPPWRSRRRRSTCPCPGC